MAFKSKEEMRMKENDAETIQKLLVWLKAVEWYRDKLIEQSQLSRENPRR
jgi:hypothetical protein